MHHYEWLVSNLGANYAYSISLFAKDHLYSFWYTLAARLNRNFTLGVTSANGDLLRDLGGTGDHVHVFAAFSRHSLSGDVTRELKSESSA
ncbi:MAG: hypothetical protein M3463_00450 [Verrucomicrobiota bacterium]|nr:hypothetical protein [Verrucomicrobiota bacterium]